VIGIVDALSDAGIRCFGPVGAAARLEGSKAFCKEIMEAAGVPTAAYSVVTTPAEGMAAITRYPVVIKADGLAAGKGVIIAADEAGGQGGAAGPAGGAPVRHDARRRGGAPGGRGESRSWRCVTA